MTTPTDKRIELILGAAYTELCKLPKTTKTGKVKKKIMEAIKIK